MSVLLLPCSIQVFRRAPPVALVSLPDVSLLFEGGQSVVYVVALLSSHDVTLLLEDGQSAVAPPVVVVSFRDVTLLSICCRVCRRSGISSISVSPDVMLLFEAGDLGPRYRDLNLLPGYVDFSLGIPILWREATGHISACTPSLAYRRHSVNDFKLHVGVSQDQALRTTSLIEMSVLVARAVQAWRQSTTLWQAVVLWHRRTTLIDNQVASMHWNICRHFQIPVKSRWHRHQPDRLVETDDTVLMCDTTISTVYKIKANRPYVCLRDKKANTCLLITP